MNKTANNVAPNEAVYYKPNEAVYYKPSRLDLHRLQKYVFWSTELWGLNWTVDANNELTTESTNCG